MTERQADFIIIGAGIAGASVAYFLAQSARVVVLERESQPGYHSSGRSAAMFMASYGPPQVRALSCASRVFFDRPPPGFCEHALLTARGAMLFAAPGQQAQLDAHERLARSVPGAVERLDAAQALRRVPVLHPEQVLGAVLEHDALDIDVNALLHGFLRGARAHGGTLVCDAGVGGLRRADGQWQVETPQGMFRAPVLVNAAGAWADELGRMAGAAPIGLVPKRRSALLFEAPPGEAIADWPMFMDADQSFYIKPDAGLLLASPVNADPVAPHDVQAEELDIAIAIDAIERLTTMRVRRPRHVWAGLRSFVPDGELVGGFDAAVPGLFWAAAQGGYGIQTAPAAGRLYAALLLGAPQTAESLLHGVDPSALSPNRLVR
ncbi:FAD-dependent oxidoreductase [Rugamonas sp. FT82W]|uniref:FAD-dependent oxidoreductase n=1 Tax=Duganella vulcania TaxID=2692166 RepID=A0A845GFV8_9BURK|nr:FAD-binding oxidoreductase [Duganella vulcania]MYM91649.1 FAD-dependent oxidoreductase [Duganella vulcania]